MRIDFNSTQEDIDRNTEEVLNRGKKPNNHRASRKPKSVHFKEKSSSSSQEMTDSLNLNEFISPPDDTVKRKSKRKPTPDVEAEASTLEPSDSDSGSGSDSSPMETEDNHSLENGTATANPKPKPKPKKKAAPKKTKTKTSSSAKPKRRNPGAGQKAPKQKVRIAPSMANVRNITPGMKRYQHRQPTRSFVQSAVTAGGVRVANARASGYNLSKEVFKFADVLSQEYMKDILRIAVALCDYRKRHMITHDAIIEAHERLCAFKPKFYYDEDNHHRTPRVTYTQLKKPISKVPKV